MFWFWLEVGKQFTKRSTLQLMWTAFFPRLRRASKALGLKRPASKYHPLLLLHFVSNSPSIRVLGYLKSTIQKYVSIFKRLKVSIYIDTVHIVSIMMHALV